MLRNAVSLRRGNILKVVASHGKLHKFTFQGYECGPWSQTARTRPFLPVYPLRKCLREHMFLEEQWPHVQLSSFCRSSDGKFPLRPQGRATFALSPVLDWLLQLEPLWKKRQPLWAQSKPGQKDRVCLMNSLSRKQKQEGIGIHTL